MIPMATPDSGGAGVPADDATVPSDESGVDVMSAPDSNDQDGTMPLVDSGVQVTDFDAPAGAPCSLSVTVTTTTNNGFFSPRNVGAIWVAQGSGAFVKTLAVWAKARINDLNLWDNATSAAGLHRNTVDAITGATLSMHQTHNAKWNCKDTGEAAVPDGPYRVYFEMTDDNGSGPNTFVDFPKGSRALRLSAPDTAHFKSIELVFVP
jgi:hypothetical protein